jgi:signal transduction histidine kinase
MSTPATDPYAQLISLAVHELRTPIGVVSGYLRMLLRDEGEPLTPRQRRLVEDADKSCVRMATLVAELSEIGKLDAGIIRLAGQSVDLMALIRDVAPTIHEASDRDVRLTVRGSSEPASITGDAGRLRTAFDAVFRAVLRERPGPATVVADCRREAIDDVESLVVVIADEPDLDEAARRDRRPFSESRGGLGLALPLARRVIEGHRGRVEAPQPLQGRTDSDDRIARSSAIVTIPLG